MAETWAADPPAENSHTRGQAGRHWVNAGDHHSLYSSNKKKQIWNANSNKRTKDRKCSVCLLPGQQIIRTIHIVYAVLGFYHCYPKTNFLKEIIYLKGRVTERRGETEGEILYPKWPQLSELGCSEDRRQELFQVSHTGAGALAIGLSFSSLQVHS